MIEILFYAISAFAVVSSLVVVFSKNPVSSVLALIATFFAIAMHYVLLNAQFLAAVHIIVYAGAIMVLFLFVIMLLNLNKESEPHKSPWAKLAGVVTGGLLLTTMLGAMRGALDLKGIVATKPDVGLIENLGLVLFQDFLVPFELSSVLFLAAMVGAVYLGQKETAV